MPTPEKGESRDKYMERCLVYPDLQKYDEKQRIAVCEHLYDRESSPTGDAREQTLLDGAERFEQFSIEPPRIDREKGELYGVRVMGIKSAHGYEYSLEAQRAVVGRYEQMPIGLSHDYSGAPVTVPDAWGVLFNPRVDDKGTIADVKFLLRHEQTAAILEDAERNIGIFSMSPVTSRVVESPKGIIKSFVPVRVDLVVRGATTKTLFEQHPADDGLKLLHEQVDALKLELASRPTQDTLKALEDKLVTFEQRLVLHEQVLPTQQQVQATIQQTTAGLDLSKFWNDPTPTK